MTIDSLKIDFYVLTCWIPMKVRRLERRILFVTWELKYFVELQLKFFTRSFFPDASQSIFVLYILHSALLLSVSASSEMHLVQVAGYNIEGSNHPFHFLILYIFCCCIFSDNFSSEIIKFFGVARGTSLESFVHKNLNFFD